MPPLAVVKESLPSFAVDVLLDDEGEEGSDRLRRMAAPLPPARAQDMAPPNDARLVFLPAAAAALREAAPAVAPEEDG